MRLTAMFQVPHVDLSRFRAALDKRLGTALRDAAREWLLTTAMNMVPVWSGASFATFTQLANSISYAWSCTPVAGAPDRRSMGIASGTGTLDAGETTPGVYRFTYSTTLPHLIINEYYNANEFINPHTGRPYFHLKTPGPYHFQEAGAQAFQEFASKLDLPGWDSILTVTTIQAS